MFLIDYTIIALGEVDIEMDISDNMQIVFQTQYNMYFIATMPFCVKKKNQ